MDPFWHGFWLPKSVPKRSKTLSKYSSNTILISECKKGKRALLRDLVEKGWVPLNNTPKAPDLRRIKHAPRALGHGGGLLIYRLPPLPPTPDNFDELMLGWMDDERALEGSL